jgi:hypothetical protein
VRWSAITKPQRHCSQMLFVMCFVAANGEARRHGGRAACARDAYPGADEAARRS